MRYTLSKSRRNASSGRQPPTHWNCSQRKNQSAHPPSLTAASIAEGRPRYTTTNRAAQYTKKPQFGGGRQVTPAVPVTGTTARTPTAARSATRRATRTTVAPAIWSGTTSLAPQRALYLRGTRSTTFLRTSYQVRVRQNGNTPDLTS